MKKQDNIRKCTIELLDCQCDIVLKCLEYYCYSANYLFQRNRKYTLKDDELKIALITDTYHQISSQIAEERLQNKSTNLENFKKVS